MNHSRMVLLTALLQAFTASAMQEKQTIYANAITLQCFQLEATCIMPQPSSPTGLAQAPQLISLGMGKAINTQTYQVFQLLAGCVVPARMLTQQN